MAVAHKLILIVWHRAGHRPALPGSRRRLLHHPHRSRNGETSPHRQARGPRVQGHPRTRHLTAQIHAATNRPGSAALHRVGYACRGHLGSRTTRPSERGDRTMTGWLLIHQRATRKRSSGSQSAPYFVDQARYGPVALAAWRCVRDRGAECKAPPSDSHRCSAMGACGRSFALCMPIPSSWSRVDESLALAAVITTLYACVASVFGGTTSRVNFPNCCPDTDMTFRESWLSSRIMSPSGCLMCLMCWGAGDQSLS